MNTDLLENSIKFHGKQLYDLILKENNYQESNNSAENVIYYSSDDNQPKALVNQTNHDFQEYKHLYLHIFQSYLNI